MGKGEIAHNEQFLLFPQCFLPIWRTFCHFHQNRNCCLQSLSIWKSQEFVIWERVNRLSENKFYFTNCKGCRNYGYADIRILCSTCIISLKKKNPNKGHQIVFMIVFTLSQTMNFRLFRTERVSR